MTVIRVGVVGFGMAARVFHAPLISSVEGLELATVAERNSSRAAGRYPGIATCRSIEEMLADSTLGLVVVATPNGTHFEIARKILEAGRSVVVDKPVAVTSAEVAQLMRLAAAKGALFIPFHNRRWDGDFQTVKKLLSDGSLGRLVSMESRLDRWRPEMPKDRLWKEDANAGGGVLLDLGSHLADQALTLFGQPLAVGAEVRRERDGSGANDAFTLTMRYPALIVTLGANRLSLPAGPRFHLRGTKGNYWKNGVDPQEPALSAITRIEGSTWGHEPAAAWGTLNLSAGGATVSQQVPTLPGDYRQFYAGVRDAVRGLAPPPVQAIDAWRVARLLEAAAESSDRRCEIPCDWSDEPAGA